MVLFRLGEVSSSSALAWIGYARVALRDAVTAPDGVHLSDDVVAALERLLDDWAAQAREGPSLLLSLEMPAEELEFLSHAFLLVSSYLADRADERGYDISPPEGHAFYEALSDAVIAALEFSGEQSSTEFAQVLRGSWPRTDRLDPDGRNAAAG